MNSNYYLIGNFELITTFDVMISSITEFEVTLFYGIRQMYFRLN